MGKSLVTKLFQGTLSLWQLFLAGSSFSVGVFVPAVEGFARPAHALDDVWEMGMGAMHLMLGPAMIVATVFLTAETRTLPRFVRSKTVRVRLLAFISLIAYLSLVLSAHGTTVANRTAVFTGVTLQALPLGIGT